MQSGEVYTDYIRQDGPLGAVLAGGCERNGRGGREERLEYICGMESRLECN